MSFSGRLGNQNKGGLGAFDIAINGTITGIRVWSGIFVDALQFQINGSSWTAKFGGPGGSASTLTFSSGEYIQRVDVHSGVIVDWIQFTTSRGRTISAGGRGGGDKTNATFNGRICRITGVSDYCDNCYVVRRLGFYHTAGKFQTPDEERQEREREAAEARRREQQRRDAEARRLKELAEAKRVAAEAERQRRRAEARAEQERQAAIAAEERRRREKILADKRAADAERRRKETEARARESRKAAIQSQIAQINSKQPSNLQREQVRFDQGANQRRANLNNLRNAIARERAQLSELSQESISPDTKVIVLLGKTGDGKSTLGNRLCGDVSEEGDDEKSPFRTSYRGDSETMEVQRCSTETFGQKLCIVDTPGLDDSAGRDREHCNKLIQYLRGCGGVNQFFLVKSCGNPRIEGTFRSMLTRFETMVGREFWQFVTVVLTGVEGRQVRRMDDYRQDLVEAISKERGCPPANVVGIGFDDGFQDTIQTLVRDVVPVRKFQCDALTSPVEELEAQEQIAAGVVRQDEVTKNGITRRLGDLQAQKRNLQNQFARA